MNGRLTALDASFLHLETPNAHMHVAWAALLSPHPTRSRPTVRSLRAAVSGRLALLPRFRQRIATDPLGVAEPRWIDDLDFDIRRHVQRLGRADEVMTRARFAELCDVVLSKPLKRNHPLWELYLAPSLEDGCLGLICKLHHAMVDGKSAVEVATLLFDVDADTPPPAPVDWTPAPQPSSTRLALEAVGERGAEQWRAARGLVRMAGSPISSGNRISDTLRRTALAVGEDLLRPAPSSFLNTDIGPERTLQRARLARTQVDRVRAHCGATINDVCLTVVAGALRELSLERSRPPAALKAMVPVSVREDDERADLGNRITFAFIDLPVEVFSPLRRLEAVQRQTRSFKRSGRPAGTQALVNAIGVLPIAMRKRAAQVMASQRAYNLVVSNIPGPPCSVFMLGAKLDEAYPVVPLSEKHALSIGIFSYGAHLHFGIYADPTALPDAPLLGNAIASSFRALERTVTKGPVRGRPQSTLGAWPSTSAKTSSRARSSTARGTSRSSSTSGPLGADPAGS
ncbi:MAG: diacylglycerol O-acyltransferase / wax synthase [Thermoleophilaceae bacterium]|jgi:WS/DGAT/MGAT family acyltransferase|nr:diacylglycerol O-acyltransferase / wax synthase [Thermoleophilaceae bacterium]